METGIVGGASTRSDGAGAVPQSALTMARLREVEAEEDLVALRARMRAHLPLSVGVHGFLDVILKCQVVPFGACRAYVAEGAEAATLAVVAPSCSQSRIQSMTIFWDADEEDDDAVVRLLKTLPGWDWSAPAYYRVTPLPVFAKLEAYFKNGRFGNGEMWCHTVLEGPLFTIEDSDIRQATIPEGYVLDSLRADDVPAVLSPWHYRWTETQRGLEFVVAKLPSVAIRRRQAQEAAAEAPTRGRLVSWCFLHNLCFLGNTFTVPEHRRQGFGSAAALAMVERLRQKGIPVRSVVDRSNDASIRYHENLGFRRQCDMVLFIMLPLGKTLEDLVPAEGDRPAGETA